MKRKMLVGLVFGLAAVVLVLGLGSCDWVANAVLQPYAMVYDQNNDALSGISVGLFTAGTTDFTSTPVAQGISDSSGMVGFGTDMGSGNYLVHVLTAAPNGTEWAMETIPANGVDNTGGKKLADFKLISTQGTLTGTVIDSRTAAQTGVTAVALRLTLKSDATRYFTATSGTGGTFTFTANPGLYTLTGAKDGYFIAPRDVIVTLSTTDVGSVQGFSLKGADYGGLSFIAVWNGAVDDVDIHMTFPVSPTGSSTWITSDTDPLYLRPILGAAAGRQSMNYSKILTPYTRTIGLATYNAVYMDVDDRTGYGPETMNLVMIPNTASVVGGANAASSDTGFGPTFQNTSGATPAPQNLAYYGSSMVYLNAYTTNSSLSNGTLGAEAKVYVIQTTVIQGQTFTTEPTNTQVEANLLGIYSVPLNTTVKAASVCRVNMFVGTGDGVEYFQIVPEMDLIAGGSTAFRGGENAIINVKARAR
jgi:hypothetical protein